MPKHNINKLIAFMLAISLMTAIVSCSVIMSLPDGKDVMGKPHHLEDGFRNPGVESSQVSFIEGLKFLWKDFKSFFFDVQGNPKTVMENDGLFLRENTKDYTVTWIGHSTLLIQMEGFNFLTDPIWSERCSPISFLGPKRFTKPGIDFTKLPNIDFVLISHNHYDHLDEETIRKLAKSNVKFFVPLKVKHLLDEWGIKNVSEYDWWDSVKVDKQDNQPLVIHCTPAQHFSGRGLSDRDRTLWTSWAVIGKNIRFYYGGDTGYFNGFKTICERLGPFDFVALPIGAYVDGSRHFNLVHENPEEAIQAYLDLKGNFFIPIHWGTFPLTFHSFQEPIIRLKKEIEKRRISSEKFLILKPGESKILDKSKGAY